MKNIIEIKNLSYKNIFNNFNICFEKNKFYSISGANNSGKTTLIRILKRDINTKNSILLNNKDLASYKTHELNKLIQAVIPLEIKPLTNSIYQELLLKCNNKEYVEYLIKKLKIKKTTQAFSKLTKRELVIFQICLALSIKPKILLLDSICNYLSKEDMKILYNFLKEYQEENSLTVIFTTNNLENTINTSYLYIINQGEIILEGKPLEVLEKDNILNKIGLKLPFMIDLSVKLRDYNLIDTIELDKNRMVDILWK